MKLSKNIKILILFLALFVTSFSVWAQSVEYFIKATLIEKIAQNVEWEDGLIKNTFTIAVLGKSPFNGELENMAKKSKIKNLPVRIIYLNKLEKNSNFQVLFICASEKKNIKQITGLIGKSVLLISDSPFYSKQGVHFNFYMEKDATTHFEIDLKALLQSGLRPDLQLLTIGKIMN